MHALREVLVQLLRAAGNVLRLLPGRVPSHSDKLLDLNVVLLNVLQAVLHEHLKVLLVAQDHLRSVLDELRDQPGRRLTNSRGLARGEHVEDSHIGRLDLPLDSLLAGTLND